MAQSTAARGVENCKPENFGDLIKTPIFLFAKKMFLFKFYVRGGGGNPPMLISANFQIAEGLITLTVRRPTLYSESNVYRRQIKTSKIDPSTERVKYL